MATIESSGLKASRQIASLRYLSDGWRNGEGVAFDVDYLNWLSEAFRQMYPVHAPEPIICPTTYGFVSAECISRRRNQLGDCPRNPPRRTGMGRHVSDAKPKDGLGWRTI